MIGTKIQECPELTNPTGDEKIPVSDGSGQAKVVKFRNISTTTQAISNANQAAQTATQKVAEMQELLDDAQDALTDMQNAADGVTQAISDANHATATAQSTISACQTVVDNAYRAAQNAGTAAQNANNAYYRLSALIEQITTLSNDVNQLLEFQQQMIEDAVTINWGDHLPATVVIGLIFYHQLENKLYIGLPGRIIESAYVETEFLGRVAVDSVSSVISLTDENGETVFVHPYSVNNGYVLERCDYRGNGQGYFIHEDDGTRINWGMAGDRYGGVQIQIERTTQPNQWKEI